MARVQKGKRKVLRDEKRVKLERKME